VAASHAAVAVVCTLLVRAWRPLVRQELRFRVGRPVCAGSTHSVASVDFMLNRLIN
jgi:hypothetical protein